MSIALLLNSLHAYGPRMHSKPGLYDVLVTAFACDRLCLIYTALVLFSFVSIRQTRGRTALLRNYSTVLPGLLEVR